MNDIAVRHPQALRTYIREHPDKARESIIEWNELASQYREIGGLKNAEEWYRFTANHPGVDKSLWVAREMQVMSQEDRSPQQQPQTATPQINPLGGAGEEIGQLLGTIRSTPENTIHDTAIYHRLDYEKTNEWLKKNKAKDFNTKEGLDFLYGSLENPESKSLHDTIEEEIRETAKTNSKLAKKIDRFDAQKEQVQKSMENDLQVKILNRTIQRHAAGRFYLEQKTNPDVKYSDVLKKVETYSWTKFAKENPKKAEEYAKSEHNKFNAPLLSALKTTPTIPTPPIEPKNEEEEKKDENPVQNISKKDIENLENIINEAEAEENPQLTDTQTVSSTTETTEERFPEQPQPKQPPQSPQPKPQQLPKIPKTGGLGRLGRGAGGLGRAGTRIAATVGRAIIMSPYFWIAVGIIILIILIIVIIIIIFNGVQNTNPNAYLPSPTNQKPLDIRKSVNKTEVRVGEEVEYAIQVGAYFNAGNQVTVIEKIPEGTSYVRSDNNGVFGDGGVRWSLNSLKDNTTERIIPPQKGPVPPGVSLPVQTISVTEEQIRQELMGSDSPYSQYAHAVYEAGVKHNVDPAFIMAIWRMESAYGSVGGYKNNPGSIVYVRDGYLGMKKGVTNVGRAWATWDTYEEGIEAIAALIEKEYYPKGQTDTWSIHSGIGDTGDHAYHGRGDIGVGDVKTWNDYVRFYYNWVDVMRRVSGGHAYSVKQTVKMTVRANTDNVWLSNTASGFAPGIGNTASEQVLVKVGTPDESKKPGGPVDTPIPPAATDELKKEILARFNISFSSDFDRNQLMAAWGALFQAQAKAPNFFPLIKKASGIAGATAPVTITTISSGSTHTVNGRNGSDILIGPHTMVAGGSDLFKQILIHELGHVIHGVRGAPRNPAYDTGILAARAKEGPFTRYSEVAKPVPNEDEEFAEAVSYYVLDNIVEQPTLDTVKYPNANPLTLFPEHLAFIRGILGK